MMLGGLDISARATAMVACPTDWDGAWPRAHSFVSGHPLPRDASDSERARRCERIANDVRGFAHQYSVRQFWIEGYAFSQNVAAHTLAEVGGVVRLWLVQDGIDIRTANMSSARKLLLGKLPKRQPKVAVQEALICAGCPAWSPDECDAFVALNYGLSEHAGAFCFANDAR